MSRAICVYCSSSNSIPDEYFKAARELGQAIGESSCSLVYGGGQRGLMGAVAMSVKEFGGHVTGVIPEFLRLPGICLEECDELIVTKDMRERKAVMESRADAFIALPGGFGTLEEMLEIITFKQLHLHSKPIIFLNTLGFFDGLSEIFNRIFKDFFAKESNRSLYTFCNNSDEALAAISNYIPQPAENKWY